MKALQFSVSIPQYAALKVLGSINRRLYYHGPLATVKRVDVPEPGLPSPQWVKIKTLLCGVCASDLNLLFLRDSPTASPFTSFPCILGHEICGEITGVGADVSGLKIGDVVTIAPHLNCTARGIDPECAACRSGRTGNCENFAEGSLSPGMFNGICRDTGGGFGEYLVAHESQVFKLPQGMPYEVGALIEPFAISLQAVMDNKPEDGDEVLVIGGGVIGSLIVRSIRLLEIDCKITVAEPSPFAAERVKKAGADHLITDGDIFHHATRITGATRYKPMLGKDILMGGFARIFDVVGNSATLNSATRCLAVGGVLSIVGIGHDVKLDLTPMWLKLQTMKGVFSYGYVRVNGEKKHVFDSAIGLAQKNQIQFGEMVTHRFSIDEYEKMIETNLSKGRNRVVKTVMSFI
jgi:(R,R)-butanediol dehydrogenase/meso-butanediol dehydrogenase/diacetyl reductase